MHLIHIKDKSCPICGCSTIIKELIETCNDKIRTHCNGERWEHRTFLCGQEITYIPNFGRIELSTYNVCTNNEEFKKAMIKRDVAKRN